MPIMFFQPVAGVVQQDSHFLQVINQKIIPKVMISTKHLGWYLTSILIFQCAVFTFLFILLDLLVSFILLPIFVFFPKKFYFIMSNFFFFNLSFDFFGFLKCCLFKLFCNCNSPSCQFFLIFSFTSCFYLSKLLFFKLQSH